MKITAVKTYLLRTNLKAPIVSSRGWWYNMKNAMLVKVETDEGIFGWGEALGAGVLTKAAVDDQLAPFIIGKDPMDTDVLWDIMYMRLEDYDPRGYGLAGLSAIDIALWDIKGKAFNMPVYKLLGGAHRRKLRCYATGMFFKSETGDLITPAVEEALRNVDAGFNAMKMKCGLHRKEELKRVQAVKEAIGPDRDLMVDFNHGYNLMDAAWLAKGMEELNVVWMEEPMPMHNLDAYRELRSKTSIPLSGGENVFGRYAFRDIINYRTVDIVQPDLCCCGGITEGMKIAAMAEVAGIKTYPHIFGSAVGLFASLQFLAAIPDVPHAWTPEDIWVEYDQTENPFRVELAEEKVEKDGNYLIVPDRPGIGVTVREDILEKYRVL